MTTQTPRGPRKPNANRRRGIARTRRDEFSEEHSELGLAAKSTPASDQRPGGSGPPGYPPGVQDGSPLPELMKVKEVCAVFKNTDRTIRNWVKAGHLHPIRIGRTLYFRRDEVEALLRKQG